MLPSKIVIASALLLSANKDLLVVRKHTSNFYMLPGGKVEEGESFSQTLIRELREELGLNFTPEEFEYLGQHETSAVNEKNTTVQGNIFLLKHALDILPDAHAELAEVLFIPQQHYKNYQLAHLLQEFALPIWLAQ